MHTIVPWFSIPAPSFLLQLAAQYPLRGYAEGTCLLEAHCVTTYCMVVEEGICQHQLGGNTVNTIGFVGAGAAFGEVACVTPYASHGSVSALTPVRARTIPRDVLLALIEENNEVTTDFLRYVIDKNNQTWKIVALLMGFSVRERFLYFINSCIAPQAAAEHQEYYPLFPNLNQTQIADMLAVNRITLARIIRPMREDGLLKTHGANLLVHRSCLDALASLRGSLFPPISLG